MKLPSLTDCCTSASFVGVWRWFEWLLKQSPENNPGPGGLNSISLEAKHQN